MKRGFPLCLLRFVIGVHGGPRFLLVDDVATKVERSGGSEVVAGCAQATTLVKLVLVDSVDHTLKKLLALFAAVGVDDMQVLGGRQKPPSVATASARNSLVHGARGGGRGPCGFLQEAGDHHQRQEDSHRRAQQQGARGRSPHAAKDPEATGPQWRCGRTSRCNFCCG